MQIDPYSLKIQRICQSCGATYTIGDYWETSENYFYKPYDYFAGCQDDCLNCWLVGPPDNEPEQIPDELAATEIAVTHSTGDSASWPYEAIYEYLCEGDLARTYEWFFKQGCHLAVLPIAKLQVDRAVTFPSGHIFYPAGYLDLDQLNVKSNDESASIAEATSKASGITKEVLSCHPLVTFPVRFDWKEFRHSNHKNHLQFIHFLSETVDRGCLDFARYQTCRLAESEDLPCRSGQVYTDPAMAGACLFNQELQEAQIIGGAVFSHFLTRGLGMSLQQYEWDKLPGIGEVGQIAHRGLTMFTQMLETESLTSKYVQAMTLFEFLAYPDQYEKFEEVKTIISRYLAREGSEKYKSLLERFHQLSGKNEELIDPLTGKKIRKPVGFRTLIVHCGQRLEEIVPHRAERKELFQEMEGYLRPVIDHMIKNSDLDFEEYTELRKVAFQEITTG